MTNAEDILNEAVAEYTTFKFDGRSIQLPYALMRSRWDFNKTCGKGTPSEIKMEIQKLISQKSIDLNKLSDQDIYLLLKKENIGVDCSGFVYHLLNKLLKDNYQKDLAGKLVRYSGVAGKLEKTFVNYKRVRRINAATLTSDLNTVPVETVSEALPGDMIRLSSPEWSGKHIAIIIKITDKEIVYAHSSKMTEVIGPHTAVIKIKNIHSGLEDQEWHEQTFRGQSYKELAFHPELGDGIRRLKCLVNQ